MTYITKEYVITGAPERDERWQYPLSAVREFLINAIIHRDYRKGIHSQFKVFRDKIVFWNIGKLPEELTIEDLYKGTEKSIPRNIKVAEIFKEAFLIERYGSGIKRAVKELTDYKLPLPKIFETVGGIEIVIYGTPQEKKESPINGKGERRGTGKNVTKLSLKAHRKSILLPRQTHPGCFAAPPLKRGISLAKFLHAYREQVPTGALKLPSREGGLLHAL
jgi:predicted HTH transcriptional regulator